MNPRSKKIWERTASRKFIGLFITVIWLVTALQPCVMASVTDLHHQSVETHLSSSTSSDHGGALHSPCPHCKTAASDKDRCAPASDDNCDGNSTFVYYERVKPVDADKFSAQFESVTLIGSLQPDSRAYSAPAAPLKKSQALPAGPSLIDLYRVYLK